MSKQVLLLVAIAMCAAAAPAGAANAYVVGDGSTTPPTVPVNLFPQRHQKTRPCHATKAHACRKGGHVILGKTAAPAH